MLNICLVDDDTIFQFTAKKMIESLDVEKRLSIFSNGEEAINHLQLNSHCCDDCPDIIFLDINMPVMNGWEFLKAFEVLKSTIAKPVTIYVVSSSVMDEDKQKAKEFSSVYDYIYKPVTKDHFRDLLMAYSLSAAGSEGVVN